MMRKTYYLSRHGCAKNQVDAELIVGALKGSGWELVEEVLEASVIVINSCGFIESAKKESLKAVFQAKKANPKAKIVLAGCLAERYANELSSELPEVDVFFGNGDISRITEVFASLLETETELESASPFAKKRVWLYPQVGVSCGARPKLFTYKASVYIKITEGCSNCCTFCAIPLIRGAVRSRPLSEIVSEIEAFLKKGVYEFNLIGQDLASYSLEHAGRASGETSDGTFDGRGKNQSFISKEICSNVKLSGLAELLLGIAKIKGDFRIRLLYIHPDNFPLDILPIISSDKRFLPYYDLPFQSASESILKNMNRRGNREAYTRLIENIRNAAKNTSYGEAVIRTTFLTGFPGETNADAEESLLFLKTVRPLWSGTFEYSPEENTLASSFKNKVPKRVALARKALLQDTQAQITGEILKNYVGKELTVLAEEIIENSGEEQGFVLARAWFQAPEVDGCVVIPVDEVERLKEITPGCLLKVRIVAVRNVDLEGTLV